MMNNKTTYSFILFVIVITNEFNGQQIYLGLGTENAYFKDYINSLGQNTLDLSYSKTQDFLIEAGYRSNLYTDRLKWNLGISYNNYKINTGVFNGNISIPLNYNLTYISFKAGALFSIVNEPKVKLQIHASISQDWLLKGTSTFNTVVNNIYTDNTFDKTLLSLHRGLSLEYNISDRISTYISYNISDSFREENKDSVNGEKYTLSSNVISCGILFKLQTSKIKCYGGF